jgi:hypothetical protein
MSQPTTRFASAIATGDAALVPSEVVKEFKLVDAAGGVPKADLTAALKGQDVEVGKDGDVKIDGKSLEGTLQSPSEHQAAAATPKKNSPPGLDKDDESSSGGEEDDDPVGPQVQDKYPAHPTGEPAQD